MRYSAGILTKRAIFIHILALTEGKGSGGLRSHGYVRSSGGYWELGFYLGSFGVCIIFIICIICCCSKKEENNTATSVEDTSKIKEGVASNGNRLPERDPTNSN